MKTIRHQETGEPQLPFQQKSDTREPDRIIMRLADDAPTQSAYSFTSRLKTFEYTDFEEIAASEAYDQVAFLEYAHEDPTRLRVSHRGK